jgi:hypothetical protein
MLLQLPWRKIGWVTDLCTDTEVPGNDEDLFVIQWGIENFTFRK